MNLITFLLIVAIVGSIVGAFVKGTARVISLVTALLAFVLLVGTPGSQGTGDNFFANLFGAGNNDTATTQNFDTPNGAGTAQGGGGVVSPQTGGTGTGTNGTAQGQGQTATTPGDLPASPLPGATGDNGRSGTSAARSVPNTATGTTGTRTTSGGRTFPSGYTSRGSEARRFRALW